MNLKVYFWVEKKGKLLKYTWFASICRKFKIKQWEKNLCGITKNKFNIIVTSRGQDRKCNRDFQKYWLHIISYTTK